MRTATHLLAIVFMLLVALRLPAQSVSEPGTGDKTRDASAGTAEVEDVDKPRPDYSREALLSAFWSDPYYGEDIPRAPETFYPLQFTILGQTFRFMPFLGSTGPASSSATPFAFVDPFQGAPVSPAYTPKTFRDRFREWRMKRLLEKSGD